MVNTVTATEARERLGEIINRVLYTGDEFVIEKKGKPVVLITRPKTKKIKNSKHKKMTSTQFLLELAKFKARGLPKDLAKNHDKYLWEEYRSR